MTQPKAITSKQIDAIVRFLKVFEGSSDTCGEASFSDPLSEFQKAVYKNGWVEPSFNLSDWTEKAREYVDSPSLLASADVGTIRKLLTTHMRWEYWSEGHLSELVENGHVLAILKRLQQIRNQMRRGHKKTSGGSTQMSLFPTEDAL